MPIVHLQTTFLEGNTTERVYVALVRPVKRLLCLLGGHPARGPPAGSGPLEIV